MIDKFGNEYIEFGVNFNNNKTLYIVFESCTKDEQIKEFIHQKKCSLPKDNDTLIVYGTYRNFYEFLTREKNEDT